MSTSISTKIPFSGTYNTIWQDLIDREQENHIDWVNEDYEPSEEEAMAYGEYLYRKTDYRKAYEELAYKYAEAFAYMMAERLGIKVPNTKALHDLLGYSFEEMTSPREYNFTTDRIFCTFSLDILQKVLTLPEVQATLPAMIKEKHSSRDGFHSFYSNDIKRGEWANPIAEWDHNQWHTVLLCLFTEEESFREFEGSVYEDLCGNNQFCNFPDFAEWRYSEWLPSVMLGNAALRPLEEKLSSLLSEACPTFVFEGYMAQLMDAPPPEEIELSYLYTKSGQAEVLSVEVTTC